MKQIGSSIRSNANYVPQPFGLQNIRMRKTLLGSLRQETKTIFPNLLGRTLQVEQILQAR